MANAFSRALASEGRGGGWTGELGAFEYKNGTIVFAMEQLDSEVGKAWEHGWSDITCSLKEQFKIVALARHWYFHHFESGIDIPEVFRAMDEILGKTNGTEKEWEPPTPVTGAKISKEEGREDLQSWGVTS
jgi:hypothetical protein